MEQDLKGRLKLVAESELAALRGITIGALRNERSMGKGPRYQKIGNSVFYKLSDIEKFLEASTVKPRHVPTLIDGKRARFRS